MFLFRDLIRPFAKFSQRHSGTHTPKYRTLSKGLFSTVSAAPIVLAMSGSTLAGGFDLGGQSTLFLFEEGNYAEASYFTSQDDAEARGDGTQFTFFPIFGNNAIAQYPDMDGTQASFASAAVKFDVNDRLALGAFWEQPYGRKVSMGEAPNAVFGSIYANREMEYTTEAISGLASVRLNKNWSIHGGATAERMAFDYRIPEFKDFIPDYGVNIEEVVKYRWIAGAAYRREETDTLLSVTYHSKIKGFFAANELVPTNCNSAPVPHCLGLTTTRTVAEGVIPDSLNVDFRTTVRDRFRIFGQLRWVNYSEMQLTPSELTTNLPGYVPIPFFEEDIYTFMLGLDFLATDYASVGFDVTYENEIEKNYSWYSYDTGRTRVALRAAFHIPETGLSVKGNVGYTWNVGGREDVLLGEGTLGEVVTVGEVEDFNTWDSKITLSYSF